MDVTIQENLNTIDQAILDNCPTEYLEQLFKKIKQLIDDFEAEGDEATYRNFRCEYHSKQACYFLTIGKLSEVKQQEKLAAKYKTQLKHSILNNEQQTGTFECNITKDKQIETLKEEIYEVMQEIRSEAEEAHWKKLNNVIESLYLPTITSYAEYRQLEDVYNSLKINFKQYSTDLLISSLEGDATEEADNNLKCSILIDKLRALCACLQQQQKAEFIRYILSDGANIYSTLFAEVPETEDRIISRYKELAKLFHPDLVAGLDLESIFTELFQKIVQEKMNKLEHLKKKTFILGDAKYYENEGYEQWNIAQDYKNAAKSNYDDLRLLNKDQLKNWSKPELEKAKTQHALLAFEHYRAAMLALGAYADLNASVRLRKYMALCLILAGPYHLMEAELYAIGTIFIMINKSETINESLLEEIYKILGRVRGTAAVTSEQISTPEKVNTKQPGTDSSLVPYLLQIERNMPSGNITYLQRIKKKRAVSDLIYDQCILRGNKTIVKHDVPQEKILEAKRQAFGYKVAGGAIAATGVGVGLGVVWFELAEVVSVATAAPAVLAAGVAAPIFLMFGGLLTIGLGIYFGVKLFKKGRSLMKEPEIRQRLNKKMQAALNHFTNNHFEEFFEELAEPYGTMNQEHKDQLIKFQRGITIEIYPANVVDQLLKHEFRPDGIAYLLNIMGEILIRRMIKLNNKTQSALDELAVLLFEEVYKPDESRKPNRLNEKASLLDEQIRCAQNQSKSKNWIYYAKRTWAENFYSIPREYLEDAEQAPFTARLEEMMNTARINFATCQILTSGEDNLKRAKEILNEVKASLTKKYQYFGGPEWRIKALQDWLFVLGVYDDPDPVPTTLLALNEQLSIDKLLQVQYIQSEEEKFRIQLFIPVNEEADLWGYLFSFSNDIAMLSRQEFIELVKSSYGSDAKFKMMMNKVLEDEHKEQCIDSVNKWCFGFLNDKQVFSIRYLQVIAYLFGVEFQYCLLKRQYPDVGIFEASGHPITPPKHISIHYRIYLVVNDPTYSTVLGLFTAHNSAYLCYKYHGAKMETDMKKKAEILLEVAQAHCEDAKSSEKKNNNLALSKWSKALEVYEEVRKFASKNHQALLGIAKCFLELHKYKRAENLLMRYETMLQNHAEFWKILAIAQRHQFNKKKSAQISINRALEIQPDCSEAARQRELIEGQLKTKDSQQYIYSLDFDANYSRTSVDHSTYNILSIDGGGIRGILPSVWLCELERKAHCPIATMFDMISGTSTGGIIATALSMPSLREATWSHDHMNDLRLGERNRPLYKASDILELYTTKHNELFTANIFPSLIHSKYSDIGRRSLFRKYYKDVRLVNALTDLLIPAVSLHSHGIYSFTNRKPDNHRFFDAVMATTSAPTYFKPYEMNGFSFVDGGVQANNPTMLAYDEALEYSANRDNVFVLSLGTGDYIPDPIHPDAHRKLLFWYSKLMEPAKIIFDGPQNNLENHMHDLLRENYHRWQVWFEDPIKLDDCRKETVEYLIDTAREYLEELEDCDKKNRLGMIIEHLVEGKK